MRRELALARSSSPAPSRAFIGERRIVSVASGAFAIEGFRIGLVERRVGAQAFDEVGVGDVRQAERDRVRLASAMKRLPLALLKPVLMISGTVTRERKVLATSSIWTPFSFSLAFGLEARLGVRLLTRNTRSVAPTEAGERLVQTVGPHFDGIDAGLAALTAMRDKPAGSLRITSVEHASDTILAPAVARLLTNYPDIRIEIINDYGLTDIVAERYDAGVRLGELVAKDLIALRIGPDFHQALVGAPSNFTRATLARHAARPDQPRLHQSAAAHLGRPLVLAIC